MEDFAYRTAASNFLKGTGPLRSLRKSCALLFASPSTAESRIISSSEFFGPSIPYSPTHCRLLDSRSAMVEIDNHVKNSKETTDQRSRRSPDRRFVTASEAVLNPPCGWEIRRHRSTQCPPPLADRARSEDHYWMATIAVEVFRPVAHCPPFSKPLGARVPRALSFGGFASQQYVRESCRYRRCWLASDQYILSGNPGPWLP
jgi:hypothetical protein